jgi:hypothetical protein
VGSQYSIKLTNGMTLTLDPDDTQNFFSEFVDQFLKPFYKESNDWNKTIKLSIMEIERISSMYHLSRRDLIANLLKIVERRLAKDISELKGVDKIEILFENIDDLVDDVREAVNKGGSQEEIRLRVAKIVENLNLFEICELLINFSRKVHEN